MKKWIIKKPEPDGSSIAQGSDLTPLCADVLASRGITTLEGAKEFLRKDSLSDPFLLKDMREATEIIQDAIAGQKKICIYGDYDCDGITSTVILFSYLEYMGADVTYYIPERAEGYGMNKPSIQKLHDEGIELIITVDNGISAVSEAEFVAELGMELIITDHHQQGEVLPKAKAIVNPHRKDCTSPFKYLCGAGVVLKLITALEDGDYSATMEQYGELVAIATIADIVCLTGENRFIVDRGLKYLPNTERAGLRKLMEVSGIKPSEISSTKVAFGIAPRINASGRFASPRLAVQLLLSEDEEEAEELAIQLNKLNEERKETEQIIVEEIYRHIDSNPGLLHNRVLVFHGADWHHGVIGIVASRMVEKFGKPVFIITEEGETSRGSARSFGDFSVFECLEACGEFLTKYGGHKGAGGFSLDTDKINDFNNAIQNFAYEKHSIMPILSIDVDKVLTEQDFNVDNVEGLKVLEPFGEGNPQPTFAFLDAVVTDIAPLGKQSQHTKMRLKYRNIFADAILFRMSPQETSIKVGDVWNFLVGLEVSEYNNHKSLRVLVKDFRRKGVKQKLYFSARNAYEVYRRNEKLSESYYRAMMPQRNEFVAVYKLIAKEKTDVTADKIFMQVNTLTTLNYCKFRIILDIFEEMNLISVSHSTDIINLVAHGTEKINLENSDILGNLKTLLEQSGN